jgi:hypothetical protein
MHVKIIIRLILKTQGVLMWTGFGWLRTGTRKYSMEIPDSIKERGFFFDSFLFWHLKEKFAQLCWTFQLISKTFSIFMCKHICGAQANHEGRVVAQALSRRPVTVEGRFRISFGKCGESGTGTGLSKHRPTGFPLPLSFHQCPILKDCIHLPPALHNPTNWRRCFIKHLALPDHLIACGAIQGKYFYSRTAGRRADDIIADA